MESFFEGLRDKAISTYHVDPIIFILLYVSSIPFYYLSFFLIFREGYRLKKNHKAVEAISLLLREKRFTLYVFVNRLAWALPYLYILIYGVNIPIWVSLIMLLWIAVFFVIFLARINRKFKNL